MASTGGSVFARARSGSSKLQTQYDADGNEIEDEFNDTHRPAVLTYTAAD